LKALGEGRICSHQSSITTPLVEPIMNIFLPRFRKEHFASIDILVAINNINRLEIIHLKMYQILLILNKEKMYFKISFCVKNNK